jgi:hypothetical protein
LLAQVMDTPLLPVMNLDGYYSLDGNHKSPDFWTSADSINLVEQKL